MNQQYWADAATQNCVWLFRTSTRKYPNGCQCQPEIYDSDGDIIEGREEAAKDCSCFVVVWNTERVFLTREEANEYGKSRPYAWGKKNEGWDIYGVPCDGIMAEIIGKHIEEFKDKVEYVK